MSVIYLSIKLINTEKSKGFKAIKVQLHLHFHFVSIVYLLIWRYYSKFSVENIANCTFSIQLDYLYMHFVQQISNNLVAKYYLYCCTIGRLIYDTITYFLPIIDTSSVSNTSGTTLKLLLNPIDSIISHNYEDSII